MWVSKDGLAVSQKKLNVLWTVQGGVGVFLFLAFLAWWCRYSIAHDDLMPLAIALGVIAIALQVAVEGLQRLWRLEWALKAP